MKAYKVDCDDAGHGAVIVFANRGKDVGRRAGPDSCDCEFIQRCVHREPKFDKYAPGPVTPSQYLVEGWYCGCSGCDKQVWGDHDFVIADDRVFCSRECLLREAEKLQRDVTERSHESMRRYRDVVLEAAAKLEVTS